MDSNVIRDDLYYQLTDLLAGDESVYKLIKGTDLDSVAKTLKKISGDETLSQKTRAQLLAESWRVNYRVKPPTIEEFLTPEWIGDTANSLFPHARKILTEFWQPNSPYRHLILASAIGLGKAQPYSSKVVVDKDSKGNFIYKTVGELREGDWILNPIGNHKVSILGFNEQGVTPIYKITLSDGRSFRTNYNHFTTVSFRQEEKWDTLTTHWMMKNLDKYDFQIPSRKELQSSSIDELENIILCHENEPDNYSRITPKPREEGKVYIDSIEPDGEEQNRCIHLDYPIGLYYTDDGVITHNSTLSSISSLYVTTTLWCMRNPNRFFKLAPSTALVTALISFTMDKTAQVLLQPFLQILKTSPKYHRVRLEEKLDITQHEDPDHVCWTTSSKMGALQFYNNLHYILTSDPAGLLGLNLIQAILSEISFFVDKGFSPEYIWRIYQDAKGRVTSRFGERYFAGTVLDSSPNDIDLSPIDKYIFSGEAENNPENYIFTGTQWKYRPELRPIWQRTGETFPVFRGSATRPAKILTPEELPDYPSDEVYDVPVDLRTVFEENCLKSVKDYCGWPAGSKGVLVREERIIEDMFIPSLRNIYTYIRAPENMNPDHLIWDTVYKQFFNSYDKGYEFWRNPAEKRYLHIDQSESGDVACIAMCHPETEGKGGKLIIVIDFCIPISPDKNRINLDAIRFFIRDLIEKGRINVAKVTFDQYQSSSTIQYLKRREIPAERLSVDASMDPYHLFISYMSSGKIKCGRNILLKNNIKSLQEVETVRGHKKIDHTRGKTIYQDSENWDSSQMGKYAKDVSDATCGSVWNCVQSFVGAPHYVWEDNLMSVEEHESRKVIVTRALKAIENKYGVDMKEIYSDN